MKSKWIKYCGPSYVTSVHIPIVLPKVIGFLQISILLLMQKESKTVATSMFSRKKLSLHARSILGSVCLNVYSEFQTIRR